MRKQERVLFKFHGRIVQWDDFVETTQGGRQRFMISPLGMPGDQPGPDGQYYTAWGREAKQICPPSSDPTTYGQGVAGSDWEITWNQSSSATSGKMYQTIDSVRSMVAAQPAAQPQPVAPPQPDTQQPLAPQQPVVQQPVQPEPVAPAQPGPSVAFSTGEEIVRQCAFKGVIDLLVAGIVSIHDVHPLVNDFANIILYDHEPLLTGFEPAPPSDIGLRQVR